MEKVNLKIFLTNFIFMQGRTFLAVLLGIFSSIIYARALGPEGKGILAFAPFLATLLKLFCNIGFSSGNVVFIANGKISPKIAFATSLLAGGIVSTVAIIIGILILLIGGDAACGKVAIYYVVYYIFLIPLGIISEYLLSIINGLQRFKQYAKATIFLPFLDLFFAWIFLIVFKWGINGAIAIPLITGILNLTLIIYWLKDECDLHLFRAENFIYIKKSFSFNIICYFCDTITSINYKLGLYIVGFMTTLGFTGLYSMGVGLAERIWLLSMGISCVLLPKVAEIGDTKENMMFSSFLARWIGGCALLFAFVLFFAIKPLVLLMYGQNFADVSIIFQAMLPGVVALSAGRILSNSIAAQGKPIYNLYSSILTLFSNILGTFLLVKFYGNFGAAWATSFSYLFSSVMIYFFFIHITRTTHKSFWMFNEYDRKIFLFIKRNLFSGKIIKK